MAEGTTGSLRGRTALVTGGSRGIGRAICLSLAQHGADVAVHYRQRREEAEQVVLQCRAYGVQSAAIQADLGDAAQVGGLMQQMTAFRSPDILVNNAGMARSELFMETTLKDWQEMMAVNLTSAFLCTQAVLPAMVRQRFGRIVNMASVWGATGAACEVAYSASKGALIAMTKALAKELASTGITVNAVAPGAIDTDMLGGLTPEDRQQVIDEIPMGRLGTPEDIAHCVAYLASPAAAYMTGQLLSPNGGWWT